MSSGPVRTWAEPSCPSSRPSSRAATAATSRASMSATSTSSGVVVDGVAGRRDAPVVRETLTRVLAREGRSTLARVELAASEKVVATHVEQVAGGRIVRRHEIFALQLRTGIGKVEGDPSAMMVPPPWLQLKELREVSACGGNEQHTPPRVGRV